jgi:exopolysaccharide biosynthesis polyprenyl glycosylphosphotransferase
MLALADVIAVVAASLTLTGSVGGSAWALVFVPVWVVLAKLLGLYDRDHRMIRHLTIDELPTIAAWAASGTAALALLLPLTPAGTLTAGPAARLWVVAAVAAALLRGTARWLWRRITPREVTAVIGEGELAEAVRRKVRLFPDMHLQLDGGFDPASVGGDRATYARLLRDLLGRVERVILASSTVQPELTGLLVAACRAEQVKLCVVSPLRGRALPVLRISQVADLPVLEYNTWDVSRSTMMLKRAFDVLVSGVALLALSPLFPIIALAIRLDSPGSVFFAQRRAGMRGRPFRMLKFRTMRMGAEQELSGLLLFDDLSDPMFKLRSDPRITRVGRVLRRFSLDEIPQLINVLRGDMSIVGPRPEQVELVDRYRPEHRFRLHVKPGVTGPMQVFGRGDLTFSERLAVELDYVENVSLARDLRILAQTLPTVLRGNGAY